MLDTTDKRMLFWLLFWPLHLVWCALVQLEITKVSYYEGFGCRTGLTNAQARWVLEPIPPDKWILIPVYPELLALVIERVIQQHNWNPEEHGF